MRRAGLAQAGAMALAATLTLSACSGSQPSAQQATPGSIPATDVNPRPADSLRQGGVLRTSILAYPVQWNVNNVDGLQGDVVEMARVLLPRPFRLNERGEPTLVPTTLTSAEVTATSPAQVVTYRINPRATWSDGTPITWRDFAAVWRADNGSDPAYRVNSTAGYAQISSVTPGADEREAKVTFSTPYADWRALFDPLYPARAYSTPAAFNNGWTDQVPITAGPFKVKTLDRTAKTVTMSPDPRWWGPKPKLDSLVWMDLDASATPDAYLNGELDIAGARDPQIYRRVAGAPNTVVRKAGQLDETQLTFNGTRGPLADVRVRQAVMLAVDRSALVKAAVNGLPLTVAPLGNHFFLPNQAAYQDNSGQFQHRDLAAAGRLLDAAGWRGGTTRARAGQPLRIGLTIVGSDGTRTRLAELIQHMLADVGVTVDIVRVPSDAFFPKYVDRGDFDMTIFRWQPTPYLSTSMAPVFQSPTASGQSQNFGGVSSPEIDALLARAARTLDPAQGRALYNQADALIWRQGHSLPLFQTPEVDATRPKLANFGAQGLSEYDYTTIGWQP